MPKNRTSKIWKISDEDFRNLVKNSLRMKDVLTYFGLQNKGNNFRTVKKRISELGIDDNHFLSRTDSSHYKRRVNKDDFINHWLVVNSNKNRAHLKNHLIKFELIPYKCSVCNNSGVWNNKRLSLQLEHINGVSNDNRLDNLCFLCPNCHSQTETFAGKNVKRS